LLDVSIDAKSVGSCQGTRSCQEENKIKEKRMKEKKTE
jgi:hypothetical protein